MSRENIAMFLARCASLNEMFDSVPYLHRERTPMPNECCGRTMKQCSVHKWKCSMCGKVKDLRKENLRKRGKR